MGVKGYSRIAEAFSEGAPPVSPQLMATTEQDSGEKHGKWLKWHKGDKSYMCLVSSQDKDLQTLAALSRGRV